MAGSCWRLLAVFSLIFVVVVVVVVPTFLTGQAATAVVSSAGPTAVSPQLPRLRYPLPIAPIWIPPPGLPRLYPNVARTFGLQQSVFEQLVRSAGIIFSGRVTSVETAASSSGQSHASTVITFRVEHAVLGAATGQNLTIHEWVGLWGRGERYRVGEHVLLFLYAPSKLGLTSPVSGAMGRFAVDSRGRIVMSPQHIPIFTKDPVLGGKTVIPYADFAVAVRRVQPEGMNEP
jgi:hypothetical protein